MGTRVTTFLRRKIISDLMMELVTRGQRALAFAHWKNTMDEQTELQAVVPSDQPTNHFSRALPGFCAAWEKVISRHENLLACAVAAGATLPQCCGCELSEKHEHTESTNTVPFLDLPIPILDLPIP